jgi:hypothetical protein
MEVGAILEGNIVDLAPQATLDLQPTAPEAPQVIIPEVQPAFEGFESQLPLSQAADQPNLHDKLGQLRISKLRQHFPRIPQVEAVAEARRFLHWDLCFADILLQRGGFDLTVGNPPWLKVEWNESGILGERNPVFAIRKISASDLTKLRAEAFAKFPGLQNSWTDELQEAEGSQCFLNASQNYPLLKGLNANLYKCFLPKGWALSNSTGVVGYLHPEGPFDDPNGGELRCAIYQRLRAHFQFHNEMKLFEIGNYMKFSINIYGPMLNRPSFDSISNLFIPNSVDLCYQHDGSGMAGGIKKEDGKWNLDGHADRIVSVKESVLALFSKLYDAPDTPYSFARLPAVHAGKLLSSITKLSEFPHSVASMSIQCYPTGMWGETASQLDGTLAKEGLRNPRPSES